MLPPFASRNTNELLKLSQSGRNPTETLVGKTVVLQRLKRDGSFEIKKGVVERADPSGLDVVGRNRKMKHYAMPTWMIVDIISH